MTAMQQGNHNPMANGTKTTLLLSFPILTDRQKYGIRHFNGLLVYLQSTKFDIPILVRPRANAECGE